MTDQELKEEMRQDMRMEAMEDMHQERRMRDLDYFLDTDVITKAIEALRAAKRECNNYEHDWQETLSYIDDEAVG